MSSIYKDFTVKPDNYIHDKFRSRVAVIVGTRPEAIKMAPVIRALRKREDEFETVVVSTGQHRQMLDQVFSMFDIKPDVDLELMRPNQSLTDLTARVLTTIQPALADLNPDLLLVQGDTTTVFAAALAAFNLKIAVGHVEAGLRSHDLLNPFPEEANRRLTTQVAEIHLAPTQLACNELLNEGVSRDNIAVTGNTVVDSLQTLIDVRFDIDGTPLAEIPFEGHRVVVVTSHRRESWGQDLLNTCLAVKDLIKRFPDLLVVYPIHMNPNVRETVLANLAGVERIHLTEPLDYLTFINLMRRADLILTDSGGVQEEAPTLGKPLLVLRKVTERPEAFKAGLAKIIGNSRESIVAEASRLLTDEDAYRSMVSSANPYGDARAADRIAEALCRWKRGKVPLLEPAQEFPSTFQPDCKIRYII